MDDSLEIPGSLLARNTALNLLGQVIPLLVGLATIPYVLRGLGAERFGILSIAWVLLGYFSLFDLGLGRATTKFVADCLGRGEVHRLPGLVWASLGIQTIFGVVGGLFVATLVPLLVNRVLKIPVSLVPETKASFYILAASLPVVLATTALRGVLEAAQRFDLANYVKVPANLSVFLLPAIALPFGLQLPGIVLLLVLARLSAAIAYLGLCFKVFPALKSGFVYDPRTIRSLVAYGGWVTVSNVVGPVLAYMDRFLIGSLLSLAALSYYTAPYEAVARLSILPGSLMLTLFPAFSSSGSSGNQEKLKQLYVRSVKFLLLVVGPAMLVLVAFARNILLMWLGRDFATNSTLAFQVLAFGFFLNALLAVPFTLLQGLGRADITAKFHLIELVVYVPLLWLLTERLGISGTAIAWTSRVVMDGLLLFGGAWRLYQLSLGFLFRNACARSGPLLLGFGTLLFFIEQLGIAVLLKSVLAGLIGGFFVWGAWHFVLDAAEKGVILSMLRNATPTTSTGR